MSRADRCRRMSMQELRRIMMSRPRGAEWAAAWFEYHRRQIDQVVAMTVDMKRGPWPCAMPAVTQ